MHYSSASFRLVQTSGICVLDVFCKGRAGIILGGRSGLRTLHSRLKCPQRTLHKTPHPSLMTLIIIIVFAKGLNSTSLTSVVCSVGSQQGGYRFKSTSQQ